MRHALRRVALVAAGLALAIASSAFASPSGTPAPPKRTGTIRTADGLDLYYRIEGRGRDTLIAVHGGPGVDLESIRGDFAPLTRRHVVIFYDQRGAGRSTLPADTTVLTAERQITDLDEVRRHFGLQRTVLVAHSYGPLLAASYALAHPDAIRGMVFFGPVPPYQGDFNERYGRTLNARLDSAQRARLADAGRRLADPKADILQACRDYWAIGLLPRLAEPERTLKLLRSDLCASDPKGIRYGLTITTGVVWNSYGAWDLRPQLRTLAAPTFIAHGETEAIPMDMVEAWTTAMPHATLLKVPRAGHFAYTERPEIVWPAVERFLASLPAR